MSEIRIIGRKKNGNCMYGLFGKASLYTFTLYGKLCYVFPETRNPRGRVEWATSSRRGLGAAESSKPWPSATAVGKVVRNEAYGMTHYKQVEREGMNSGRRCILAFNDPPAFNLNDENEI